MNYKVKLYKKGLVIMNSEEEAKTHAQAAKQALLKCFLAVTHICVVGKSTKRYAVGKGNTKISLIRAIPRVFKTTRNSNFCVLVMFGSIVEFHNYYDEKDRDAAYEKAVQACTELESAASAKASPVQSDITASTVETNDSESGSTETKTSNGFAMTAMLKDLETLTSIDKTSGKDKSGDWVASAWRAGYEVSRSKPKTKTLWATVKLDGHDLSEYPTANKSMQAMNGKTIEVEKAGNISKNYSLYAGESYYWQEKWLDFENITATVLPTPVDTRTDGVTFIHAMNDTIGKTLRFVKCSRIGNHKKHWSVPGGFCYSQDWLILEPFSNPKKELEELKNTLDEEAKAWEEKMYGSWKVEKPKYGEYVIKIKSKYFSSDAS